MENMSVQMSIDQQQSRQQQQQHSLSWWPIHHHHHNQQHSPRPQKQFTLPSFKELCVFEDKGPGELQSLLHADFMCEDSKLFGGIDLCHANDNDQSTPSSSFTAPPEVSDDSSQVSLESSSPSSTCSSVPPPSLEPCFSPVSTVSPERVAACNPLLLIAPIKKAPKRPFNIHSQGPSHQCANCNAINSPLWRRHPDLAQSWLCNACGLCKLFLSIIKSCYNISQIINSTTVTGHLLKRSSKQESRLHAALHHQSLEICFRTMRWVDVELRKRSAACQRVERVSTAVQ